MCWQFPQHSELHLRSLRLQKQQSSPYEHPTRRTCSTSSRPALLNCGFELSVLRSLKLNPRRLRYSRSNTLCRGVAAPFEKEYIRKDGSRIPIFISFVAFDKDALSGVAFVFDMTGRKRQEAATRESEGRYRVVRMALTHANRLTTVRQLQRQLLTRSSNPLSRFRRMLMPRLPDWRRDSRTCLKLERLW
jgi:PAS domain-containing protein